MTRPLVLPEWATKHPNEARKHDVVIDLDQAIPAYLAELGVAVEDADQYWITVAMECAKFDVRAAVAGTELAPPEGGGLFIHFKNCPKWKLSNFPEGFGEQAAKKGDPKNSDIKRARDHYKRIRGLI